MNLPKAYPTQAHLDNHVKEILADLAKRGMVTGVRMPSRVKKETKKEKK